MDFMIFIEIFLKSVKRSLQEYIQKPQPKRYCARNTKFCKLT